MTPLMSIGFRPFYLLGAAWAVIAILAWALAWRGAPPAGAITLDWHVHEMLFGFAPAIVAGFLLTAVRNWTGRDTAHGGALALLAAIWLVGRVGMLAGGALGAVLAASFLPMLIVAVTRPILASRNRRNYGVPAMLAMWTVGQVAYLSATHGLVTYLWRGIGQDLGFGALALLLALIGGRVIPAFTANAIAAARPRRWAAIEALALWGLAALVVGEALAKLGWVPRDWLRVWAGVVAIAHVIRLVGFVPWHTVREPLLLALPLGYAWLPVYFLLLAFDATRLATHALSVGAIGGMMLAMMTRSALGHTGRALRAGPVEIACFVLVHGAALLRVAATLPSNTDWVSYAAAAFAAAFAMYLIKYVPILIGARRDT